MLNKPDLADALIAERLRVGFGISSARIEFLPVGNDTFAFVYRVLASDGTAYFLKARKGDVYPPSLLVPCYVQDHGVPQAIAPLPTISGGFSARAGDFTLIVYPFVDGKDAMTMGMTDVQWVEYGAIVRAIHDVEPSAELRAQVPTETFEPDPFWSEMMATLNARIGAGEFDGGPLGEAANFWKRKRAEFDAIMRRTSALGQLLREARRPLVLCHADIHTANILVDVRGGLHVVDWDQPIFAPKERDLMFVSGAGAGLPVESHQHALFMHGYGASEADIDWLALAYYRYLWVVQDVGDYAWRAFILDDIGEDARAAAVRELPRLFEPGNIVDAATIADAELRRRTTIKL